MASTKKIPIVLRTIGFRIPGEGCGHEEVWSVPHFLTDGRPSYCWQEDPSPHVGICVVGEDGPRRTPGKPATMRKLHKRFGPALAELDRAGGGHRLQLFNGEFVDSFLLALIATESGGNSQAVRDEPRLKDASFGIGQMLTSTALGLAKRAKVSLPAKSLPQGGNRADWAKALGDDHTSLRLIVSYFDGDPKAHPSCAMSAMAMYAWYNAGGVYPGNTPWGLRAHDPDGTGPKQGALDRFAAWYGDARQVIEEQSQ